MLNKVPCSKNQNQLHKNYEFYENSAPWKAIKTNSEQVEKRMV